MSPTAIWRTRFYSGLALALVIEASAASDGSQTRKLRGGSGDGGGGSDSGSCEGLCGDPGALTAAIVVSTIVICGFVGYICCKIKKTKYRFASLCRATAAACVASHHPLTVTTASQMLRASSDRRYSTSWICNMCDARSEDVHATIVRCPLCRVDFCQTCYHSKGPSKSFLLEPVSPKRVAFEVPATQPAAIRVLLVSRTMPAEKPAVHDEGEMPGAVPPMLHARTCPAAIPNQESVTAGW